MLPRHLPAAEDMLVTCSYRQKFWGTRLVGRPAQISMQKTFSYCSDCILQISMFNLFSLLGELYISVGCTGVPKLWQVWLGEKKYLSIHVYKYLFSSYLTWCPCSFLWINVLNSVQCCFLQGVYITGTFAHVWDQSLYFPHIPCIPFTESASDIATQPKL